MINCPICKTSNNTFFCNINKWDYYQCNNCELVFLYPMPSVNFLNNYYKSKFNLKLNNNIKNKNYKKASNVINNLIKLNPKGKKLLDVGSGYSTFEKTSIEHNISYYGVEPSKNIYDTLSKQLKNKVINSNFSYFLKKNTIKYDYIIISHLIEHLVNPINFIQSCLNILEQNGIIYIETPNISSHLFKAEQCQYTFLTPPEHINLFSIKSFEVLSKNISCKIIKFETYSHPEHFYRVIKSILHPNSKKSAINTNQISLEIPYENNFKIIIFNKILFPLLYKVLNFKNKGSITGIYIKS